MGPTHKTDETFQNVTVHLFVFKFEVFGLALLDSLANDVHQTLVMQLIMGHMNLPIQRS